MAVAPAPLVIEPSGFFDGNDGNWSSFTIRVGNPPTNVRVLISTLVPETWVVLPAGCTFNDPSNCTNSRGNTFDPTQSTTWIDKGRWSLAEEITLGVASSEGGNYGYDTLGVQIHGSSGAGVILDHQVIAGIATKDFYIGNLGLAQRTPAFGGSQQTSFLQSLRNKNIIPSLSYGYTAGAYYRGDSTFASLTLGGYDDSKLVPNDVSFSLAGVATHDLVVGIQSITYSDSQTGGMPLMPYGAGKLTFIDSTLPNLWLPTPVCDAFAQAFGLTFSSLRLYYTINETMHDANIQRNASVTFQLANFVTGGKSVNITIPYSSFDLNSTALIPGNSTRYFPLRQANAQEQYTLGRAFLQEAYLSVDYERGVFNVSQTDFSGRPSHIIVIPSLNTTQTTSSGGSSTSTGTPGSSTDVSIVAQSTGLGTGAIAGIAVGIVLLAILLASAVIFVLWKKKKDRKRRPQANTFELPTDELPTDNQRSPTDFFKSLNPVSKHHWGSKHIEDTSKNAVETDGTEVHSPEKSHAAARPPPPIELEGPGQPRAELDSPEPPDVGAVSPQSEKPGMELRVPSSPNISSATPSAFRSPTIGHTRFDDVTTPPPPLSPESERDYFYHS